MKVVRNYSQCIRIHDIDIENNNNSSVIMGSTGTISESFRQYPNKVQNIFSLRNYITCSTNCKYRTAATLYALDTWFQVYNYEYSA
jgi:hypothetical protein